MSDYKLEVGGECEVLNQALDMAEWEKCIPLFIGEFIVVYSSESCKERTARRENVLFRPIRTQQDIERDIQIAKLNVFISDWQKSPESIDALGELLYYAGYHIGPKVGEKVHAVDIYPMSFKAAHHDKHVITVDELMRNFAIFRKVAK